jgi:glutathione S-transferase
MALELYNFPPSTCSLKVRIALAEKELKWVDHRLLSKNNDHLKPEYLKLNPNGVVPTLVHEGAVVTDSSVILEYLDEVFPEVKLTPDEPVKRAKMRSWLRFFEEVPTPAVRYPSFEQVLLRHYAKLSNEELDVQAESRPLKREFYKTMGTDGFEKKHLDKAMGDMRLTVDRMEKELSENGPWLIGEHYTIADICVAPLIDRMEDLGHEYLWKDTHPHVVDWFKRMKARPAYTMAYYHGARFSQIYPDLNLPGTRMPS